VGRTFEVTVNCPALEGKSGVKLEVLVAAPPGGMRQRLPNAATFDAEGQCKILLPAGVYRFEVLHLDPPATLIALKTTWGMVKRPTTVALAALEPQPIRLRLGEEPDIPLHEVAIRSDAAVGEVCWKAPGRGSGSEPRVIASPRQSYRLRAIGESGTIHVATWHKVPAAGWTIHPKKASLATCRFRIRNDGPKVGRADAVFTFPDGRMTFPVSPETRFVTNRRFLSFGFDLELANGRKVAFRPQLGDIRKHQVLTLGGPLSPIAWATVMRRKLVGKPETTHLLSGADLVDPQGHLVDEKASSIDAKLTVETSWGRVGPDVELGPTQAALLRGPLRPVRVTYSCHLDRPATVTLEPVGFVEYAIPGFMTAAPPHWRLQALNYLAKARRVYGCVEEYEMRPARHAVTIRWHNAPTTAWGGCTELIMPFRDLAGSFDHYDHPFGLSHEMLHSFEYVHGEAMERAVDAVKRKQEQFRWYMADHPEADPDLAFVLFRV
jgi:hypothetical protein